MPRRLSKAAAFTHITLIDEYPENTFCNSLYFLYFLYFKRASLYLTLGVGHARGPSDSERDLRLRYVCNGDVAVWQLRRDLDPGVATPGGQIQHLQQKNNKKYKKK
jgi:hypothetical protein